MVKVPILSNSNFLVFLLLCLIAILFNAFIHSNIVTESVLVDYLQNQMSYERIYKLIQAKEKWSWLNYTLLPIFYFFKCVLLTLWLLCGAIIFDFKASFKGFFKVVLMAEFVWLIPSLLLIIWYGFIDTGYSYSDIQYFAPLSLLSLFENPESLDSWLVYPLKSLNIFELAYIIALSVGIMKIMKKDFNKTLEFTLPVYGSSLVVWLLFITFLSINLGS